MSVNSIVFALSLALLAGMPAASAQQPQPATPPSSRDIRLDVAVNTKAGQPVTKLTQQNFTVFDNKNPRPITSFKVITPADEPINVIVVADAVNSSYRLVAFLRDGIEKFLKANGGHLAYPTALAVLTDQGLQLDGSFWTDGNALSDVLEHRFIGLREINRSADQGDHERLQISMDAFHQLVEHASALPGRKIVIWVSPGWPMIPGTGNEEISPRQQEEVFSDIVAMSTGLRQIDLTLYNINPIGVGESLRQANSYEAFLQGVSKPSQVEYANIGLQVFAVHSGGLAIESNSDVSGMIDKCLTDAQSWYQIDFDPLPADKPNEYHRVEIKVDQPGLVVRTRDGYYSNPGVTLVR